MTTVLWKNLMDIFQLFNFFSLCFNLYLIALEITFLVIQVFQYWYSYDSGYVSLNFSFVLIWFLKIHKNCNFNCNCKLIITHKILITNQFLNGLESVYAYLLQHTPCNSIALKPHTTALESHTIALESWTKAWILICQYIS